MKNLIIIGDGETAELANDYFSKDSKLTPYLHAVDSKYKSKNKINGCDVITIEDLQSKFSKENILIFIAIGSNKINSIRTFYFNYFKKNNYKFASYISSKAFVWHDVRIGDNVFILENNVIQKGCIIGNNVTLWSGNHIGHRTIIHDNCFVTSHVSISGFCSIGKNSYIGVNSTIINNIKISEHCFINAGCLIKKNLDPYSIVNSRHSEVSKISTKKFFKI